MISTIVKPRDDRKIDLFPKGEKLELEEDLETISLASLYLEAIRSFLLSFSQKHILKISKIPDGLRDFDKARNRENIYQ